MYSPTQPGTDTSSIGAGNVQALTFMSAEPATPSFPVEAMLMDGGGAGAVGMEGAGGVSHPVGGNPVWVILVGILLIVVLGWIRKASGEVEGQTIALNAFNFILMIVVVMVGFVIVKTIFTLFPVPAVTQFVHAA